VLAVASLACAFGPSIGVMMAARLVQGFAGGWAVVIARSIVVDLTSGARLVRAMNLIAGVAGVAPIVGPLLGAAILQFSHWRVSFWVVTGLAVLMLAAVAIGVPETLPAGHRHGGGLAQLASSAGGVARNRRYVGYLLVFGLSMGAIFAYVATSAFVLQSMNGLSPVLYSVDFAFNAVGLTVATLVAARLADKAPTRVVVGVGLAATGVTAVVLLVGAAGFGLPLPVALIGFFVLMSAQGLVGPNAGALASGVVPDEPGTGSALLGFLQWCMAGVIAPLAGLGGEHTAVPMATIVAALTAVSVFALVVLARPRQSRQPTLTPRKESADAWGTHVRARRRARPGPARPEDRAADRCGRPAGRDLRVRVGPVALPRPGHLRLASPDGARIRRIRRRDRLRDQERQSR
jgi:DHA1 family bicyclomycin/chloramphenicol resistance-like MFS transporter